MREPHYIVTMGLTEEEHAVVERNLPARDCETFQTCETSDLVVHGEVAAIMRASAISQDSLDFLVGYYEKVGSGAEETIVWIGDPAPPKSLRKRLKHFSTFEELEPELKYVLLSARNKARKSADYSEKIACGIMVLLLIRKNPGITTQNLAYMVGVSTRSIQRYIASLNMAGEWIEYDYSKRGWKVTSAPCF